MGAAITPAGQAAMEHWRRDHGRRWLVQALLAALVLAGCDRITGVFADREKVEAANQARAAIDAYSQASERANAAHRNVIEAFAKANGAENLEDYKAAMREQVLPRMTVFVERLESMQTGTAELQRVHNILVTAYQTARVDMAKFVDELQSPSDLKRFNAIRQRLQGDVARYRAALNDYYTNFNRKLRGGQDKAQEGAAPASAATPVTR